MKVVGADPAAWVHGAELLPGKASFFFGNDPTRWRTKVPTYSKVRVSAIYPGIDLVYYGVQGQLRYDFITAPGADPGLARVAFHGIDRLELSPSGDLLITAADREVMLRRPLVYQDGPDGRRELSAAYLLLNGGLVSFQIDGRDPRRGMVISAALACSTELGADGSDFEPATTVDGSGNVYVAGSAASASFPTLDPLQIVPRRGSYDVFIAKLDPSGSRLVYTTYLGGSSSDFGLGLAVDLGGGPFVTGFASSPDFPVTGSLETASGGQHGAFLARLSAGGSSLVHSAFFGGDHDRGRTVDTGEGARVTSRATASRSSLGSIRTTGDGAVLGTPPRAVAPGEGCGRTGARGPPRQGMTRLLAARRRRH